MIDGEPKINPLREELDHLMGAGDNRYINLFTAIKAGGYKSQKGVVECRKKQFLAAGKEFPDELLETEKKLDQFIKDEYEVITEVGIRPEEVERYFELSRNRVSADFVPTEDDIEFVKEFLGRVERVLQGMVQRGYSENEVTV